MREGASPPQVQRSLSLRRFGGPEGFELVESPMPTPGEGEVRVRVLAASVQFTDVLLRTGKYPDLGQWYRADLEQLFELLAQGRIHPRIAERIGLADVADAHRRIERGGLDGKIVICP